MTQRVIAAAGALLLALLLSTAPLEARLGGGQSYSRPVSSSPSPSSGGSYGGSSSRSSYGGGSYGGGSYGYSNGYSGYSSYDSGPSGPAADPFAIFEIAWWILRYGWPYLLAILGLSIVGSIVYDNFRTPIDDFLYDLRRGLANLVPPSREAVLANSAAVERPRPDLVSKMERLRAVDANFSEPVFLDFAQLVFARAQSARGSGESAPLAPFVSRRAIEAWEAAARAGERHPIQSVTNVIVGSLHLRDVRPYGGVVEIDVFFEANLDEKTKRPGEAPSVAELYVEETWTFRRASGILSATPEQAAALGCPSCGAPVDVRPDGTCAFCSKPQTNGRSGWTVGHVRSLKREPRRPIEPSSLGGVEAGTYSKTVLAPNLAAELRAFTARNPSFTMAAFERRVTSAFLALQDACGQRDWERIRPFETDSLFQTHRFWMERFHESGLVNRCDQVKVERVVLAKISRDAFYEAITVRIYASMLDYTLDAAGRLASGSKTEPREFSEYWTWIRRAGVDEPPDRPESACPSCGAPLRIDMSGICSHCSSKITTGHFGWVLSAIEQDEAYRG